MQKIIYKGKTFLAGFKGKGVKFGYLASGIAGGIGAVDYYYEHCLPYTVLFPMGMLALTLTHQYVMGKKIIEKRNRSENIKSDFERYTI